MDRTIFDIVSICVGWVGLYGAIKVSRLEEFKNVYGANLKNYKKQVIDNYKNNISILLTLLVFLGQLVIKIFEDEIPERSFSHSTYFIISGTMIFFSLFLFRAIIILSKKIARNKWFKEIRSRLIDTETKAQEIYLSNKDYQQIEKHIEYFEDILEIPNRNNSLEKRFERISVILHSK